MDQFVEVILQKKQSLKGQRVKDRSATKSAELRNFWEARGNLRSAARSAG